MFSNCRCGHPESVDRKRCHAPANFSHDVQEGKALPLSSYREEGPNLVTVIGQQKSGTRESDSCPRDTGHCRCYRVWPRRSARKVRSKSMLFPRGIGSISNCHLGHDASKLCAGACEQFLWVVCLRLSDNQLSKPCTSPR
jgi:hypothetical protein